MVAMTTKKAQTVADYIAAAPADKRATLKRLRRTIKAAAPQATEGMSYGLVGYKYRGKPLIGLGYWKAHISLYGSVSRFRKELAAELEPYVKSKGTIQFTTDEPVSDRLITRMVEARAAEIDRAASGRRRS